MKSPDTVIPAETFERVTSRGERAAIHGPRGHNAVLISERDAALLEKLEDRYWAESAEQALGQMRARGEKPVALEEVKHRFGA